MPFPDYPHTNFKIALIEPEIPNNTGNIGRTCVGTYSELHLVGKLGFDISDKQLKRAGLDYWPNLRWWHHPTWEEWWNSVEDQRRVFFFSKKAARRFDEVAYRPGDWLVFGKETKGLGERVLATHSEQLLRIPIEGPIRSLNLASAVAVAIYEGLRQIRPPSP
jgi:tRNA (cytidine/uridine-2'-O-)-methyltransferase